MSGTILGVLNFFKNTQNCFAFISATKDSSVAVLYSKQIAGYPLLPHIETIAIAYKVSDKALTKSVF